MANRVAQRNLQTVQDHQKEQYDRQAKEQDFQMGQRILVLLLSSTSKLFTCWHGPFKIVRQVDPVDYKVLKPGHKKQKQIYYVNLLKLWGEREGLLVTQLPEMQ